ncbi:hypothetical protein C922_05412 [Plasmodium inui San Antonio 1]|uniref:Uncharacterized protein n=1 Tax=Plasmodium inui San Antonio 1 TaxID=1237626 RepID=W7AFY3_9APIC|nr:hypothetical protein C922_05412 [Plasmodium inui San Antonio 1]EUD64201.1 hypothetical protein C922_05412 [Plasmodium inui San Antonio 1]
MYESSTGGLSWDLKPRNSFVQALQNIKIVMITRNMESLQGILQKIRYIEQRVLTTGINIIIEFHKELNVAIQKTLSMRNKKFSTRVKSRAEYLLRLQRGKCGKSILYFNN